MNREAFVLCVVLTSVACLAAVSAQQTPAHDPGAWTIEYSVSGGIAFNVHALRVTRAGELAASDHRLGMDVTGRASPELLTKLGAFIQTARDAKKTPPMPDAIGASLTVTVQGRRREVEPTPDISAALESAWNDAVRHALVGSWTQSGWKPCNPAEKMTSESIDVPIDDLTFREGGTFELTWRGGGARTTGVPHVALPDFSGRYMVMPPLGSIQFTVPPPAPTPRDFAGDGSFQIAAGQLTLKRVWLGTRTAPRRPDLCDLTFSRKQ